MSSNPNQFALLIASVAIDTVHQVHCIEYNLVPAEDTSLEKAKEFAESNIHPDFKLCNFRFLPRQCVEEYTKEQALPIVFTHRIKLEDKKWLSIELDDSDRLVECPLVVPVMSDANIRHNIVLFAQQGVPTMKALDLLKYTFDAFKLDTMSKAFHNQYKFTKTPFEMHRYPFNFDLLNAEE